MLERVMTPVGPATVEHVGITVLKVVVDGKTASEWWSKERVRLLLTQDEETFLRRMNAQADQIATLSADEAKELVRENLLGEGLSNGPGFVSFVSVAVAYHLRGERALTSYADWVNEHPTRAARVKALAKHPLLIEFADKALGVREKIKK